MTGSSTITPQVLVDGWPEDIIEDDAWVEVCGPAATELMALKILQRAFPEDDRVEGEVYASLGEQEYFRPAGTRHTNGHYSYEGAVYDPREGPWLQTDAPGHPDTKKFWRFRISSPT
jgi:hypothetical protein